MTSPRARAGAWAIVAVLAVAAEAGQVLSLPLAALATAIPDDSFFYLRLAQQFWSAGEFTFDGHNPTYGFQPLWQLLVIGLQPLCGGEAALLRVVLVLCCALHVATGAALLRLGARLAGPWCGAIAAGVWLLNPAVALWCWCLKENALYALLWVLALTALHGACAHGASRRGMLRLGLWLGLAVLTRINALGAAAVLLAVLVGAPGVGRWPARLRAAALAAGLAAALAAPWYLYAHLHFGTALPTSGAWKMLLMRGKTELQLGLPWLGAGHLGHALAATPAYLRFLVGHGYGRCEAALGPLLLLAAFGRLRRGPLPPGTLPVLCAALAAAVLSAASNQLCLEEFVRYADWYAVTEFVAVPLVAGVAAALAARWLTGALARTVAAAALALAAVFVPHPPGIDSRLQPDVLARPPHAVQLLEMGLWLRAHLPADAGVGLWDPGIVSFFRGGRSVSFDPLMNSLDYQQRFVADPFGFPHRYVGEQGIAYMVGGSVADDPTRFAALPEREGGQGPAGEVIWLPYPDHDLGWGGPGRRWFLLVRPAGALGPAALDDGDFGFGVLWPNDPARRRVMTGDRDRLLAGLGWQADVLRVQLVLAAGATAALHLDGAAVRTFTAADNGWVCLDARGFRGRTVRLVLGDGATPAAVPQAQIVDHGWP